MGALEEALEAGQEDSKATFENLYRVATERGRRASSALLECIEAVRRGVEPPSARGGEVTEEDINQELQGPNAYRIWKYNRK